MADAQKTDRVMIHADNNDSESGHHPLWRGSGDEDLQTFPFAADGDLSEETGMREINSRLERMLDKAPSDSSANLLVRKTRDGSFKAFLRIRGANQRFAGFIKGSRLVDVVERVISDVRGQIDEWKAGRQLADESL